VSASVKHALGPTISIGSKAKSTSVKRVGAVVVSSTAKRRIHASSLRYTICFYVKPLLFKLKPLKEERDKTVRYVFLDMECTQEERCSPRQVTRAHKINDVAVENQPSGSEKGVQDPKYAYLHEPVYINCQVPFFIQKF
jgi:hypothetical protein